MSRSTQAIARSNLRGCVLKRFPWLLHSVDQPSIGDRIIAALLAVLALAVAVVLILGFGFVLLVAAILAIKLVLGLAIYRWWMQRRERQMRADNFRPKAYEDGSTADTQPRFEHRNRLTIDVQVIDKKRDS